MLVDYHPARKTASRRALRGDAVEAAVGAIARLVEAVMAVRSRSAERNCVWSANPLAGLSGGCRRRSAVGVGRRRAGGRIAERRSGAVRDVLRKEGL